MSREIHIHDGNFHRFVDDAVVDGERKKRGLIPRNYEKHPVGHYRSAVHYDAVDIPLIDPSTYSERIRDKIANKSQISDLRLVGNGGQPIPALDQNGKGYCWAHSSTSATMMTRMLMNLPYVALSAYAIACIIKNYRDEGGWGAQSLDFITERGVPSSTFWAMQSMSRSNDNAKTWENAALHRMTSGWVDLQSAQYDRKLSWNQVASLLLSDVPVVVDYNWWSHSVCAIDLIETTSSDYRDEDSGKLITGDHLIRIFDSEAGPFGVRILNSWGDSWSDQGMGKLSASKSIPDSSVAPLVYRASAA
jgi:hypothetical protein